MAKQRLVEHIIVRSSEAKPLPLNESTKTIMHEGRKYRCLAAYRVPISRPNQENLNGRVYSDKLWENVITKQKETWDGAFGLMDHPKEEGSFKDTCCVWHNMSFNEDRSLVEADMYLFGPHGKHIQEAIEAGGKVGLSSSGFGELDEDETTVVAETYEIERPSDVVLNPSYNVFATGQNEISSDSDTLQNESVDSSFVPGRIENPPDDEDDEDEDDDSEEKESSQESLTIDAEAIEAAAVRGTFDVSKITKENIMTEQAIKLNEKAVELNLLGLVADAEKQEGLLEQKRAFESILSYIPEGHLADLKANVEGRIATLEEQIGEMAEKAKGVEDLEKQVETATAEKESINEQVTSLTEELEETKTKLKVAEKSYEKASKLLDEARDRNKQLETKLTETEAVGNSKVSAEKYSKLLTEFEKLEAENERLKRRTKIRRKPLRPVRESREESQNEEPKSKVEESADVTEMNFRNDAEVRAYFDERVEEDPRYAAFEKEITRCKTIQEAQIKAMKLDLDSVDQKESVKEETVESRLRFRESDDIGVIRAKYKSWF